MNEALKPCPFCGSKAKYGKASSEKYESGEFIECINSACAASSCLIFACKEDIKEQLAERWNHRAPDADHAALRGLVRELVSALRGITAVAIAIIPQADNQTWNSEQVERLIDLGAASSTAALLLARADAVLAGELGEGGAEVARLQREAFLEGHRAGCPYADYPKKMRRHAEAEAARRYPEKPQEGTP